jgi:hypothetical protein
VRVARDALQEPLPAAGAAEPRRLEACREMTARRRQPADCSRRPA